MVQKSLRELLASPGSQNRFQLSRRALRGPRTVTRHGKPVVRVVAGGRMSTLAVEFLQMRPRSKERIARDAARR